MSLLSLLLLLLLLLMLLLSLLLLSLLLLLLLLLFLLPLWLALVWELLLHSEIYSRVYYYSRFVTMEVTCRDDSDCVSCISRSEMQLLVSAVITFRSDQIVTAVLNVDKIKQALQQELLSSKSLPNHHQVRLVSLSAPVSVSTRVCKDVPLLCLLHVTNNRLLKN